MPTKRCLKITMMITGEIINKTVHILILNYALTLKVKNSRILFLLHFSSHVVRRQKKKETMAAINFAFVARLLESLTTPIEKSKSKL